MPLNIDEDPFDKVMRKAADIKVRVIPTSGIEYVDSIEGLRANVLEFSKTFDVDTQAKIPGSSKHPAQTLTTKKHFSHILFIYIYYFLHFFSRLHLHGACTEYLNSDDNSDYYASASFSEPTIDQGELDSLLE